MRLHQSASDGSDYRATLELAAARGNADAIAALEEIECPEPVAYLVEWAFALVGRSGDGMNGPSALSYATIDAWARLTDVHPAPHEVAALLTLDAAIRHPEPRETAPVAAPAPQRAWPTKKGSDGR